jgi:hypothetical protein
MSDIYYQPKSNNALMNFSFIDYIEDKKRPEAAKHNSDIKKKINENLFSEDKSDDKINRQFFERQFYINPNTQIMNKQKEFALWLYGNKGNCKDLSEDCDINVSKNYHFRYDKSY